MYSVHTINNREEDERQISKSKPSVNLEAIIDSFSVSKFSKITHFEGLKMTIKHFYEAPKKLSPIQLKLINGQWTKQQASTESESRPISNFCKVTHFEDLKMTIQNCNEAPKKVSPIKLKLINGQWTKHSASTESESCPISNFCKVTRFEKVKMTIRNCNEAHKKLSPIQLKLINGQWTKQQASIESESRPISNFCKVTHFEDLKMIIQNFYEAPKNVSPIKLKLINGQWTKQPASTESEPYLFANFCKVARFEDLKMKVQNCNKIPKNKHLSN